MALFSTNDQDEGLALLGILVDLILHIYHVYHVYARPPAQPHIHCRCLGSHTYIGALLAVFSTNDHVKGLALLAIPVDLIYIYILFIGVPTRQATHTLAPSWRCSRQMTMLKGLCCLPFQCILMLPPLSRLRPGHTHILETRMTENHTVETQRIERQMRMMIEKQMWII